MYHDLKACGFIEGDLTNRVEFIPSRFSELFGTNKNLLPAQKKGFN